MESPFGPQKLRWFASLLAIWGAVRLEESSSHWLPTWFYACLHAAAAIGGAALAIWAVRSRPSPTGARSSPRQRSAAASIACLLIWQAAIFYADFFLLDAFRASVARWGTGVIFLIGLAWTVWYVDLRGKGMATAKPRRDVFDVQTLDAERKESAPRIWHPFHPQAWYYGKTKNRKLNQSMTTLAAYTLAFAIAFLVLTNLRGCQEVYDLPAGGGQQQTVAQTVKVKKIIRKKYVFNPYSNILIGDRDITEPVPDLESETEHLAVIGQGKGTGPGFGGGKPRGKVRFIRLEYDGGDWNQDFGVGGDLNMLIEYGIRTQHPVEKKTESRRILELSNFRKFRSPPMVYLTGQRRISTSKAEDRTLREYLLEQHGMIFCDNGGSRTFHNQFLALMNRLLPDIRPVPVPLDDKIHRVPFAIPYLPYVAPHGGTEALGWYKDGRWLCYYHPGDIGDAWADGHAGVKPEVWEACYRLGVNVMFYANANYSEWVLSQQKSK